LSNLKREPKFSFGTQKRKFFREEEGPSPITYTPNKIALKKAPTAAIPLAERFVSANPNLCRNKSAQILNRTNSNKWLKSPGPGDYYLPAAFAKQQSYNRSAINQKF
jgi:hypothetical protein